MAKKLPLNIVFYLGILILFASILFQIQHWPGVINIFYIGFVCHVLFFVLFFIETIISKKANSNTKVFWILPYAAILLSSLFIFPQIGAAFFVISGAIYLFIGRKYFI